MSRTFKTRRALLLAPFAIGIFGCPTPVQYGGPIPVDTSGFEARARMLCGTRLASHASAVCAPDAHR